MKVAILSNLFEDEKDRSEYKEVEEDLMDFGMAVKAVLEKAGHEVVFFDVNEGTYEELRNSDVDIAFNVCERFKGNSLFEPHIASMLEMLDIPYTGSGHLTLATCINKVRVKEILMHHGILTPNYQVFYSRNKKLDPELKFPLIVKPVCMDNSIGITNDSVVHTEEELRTKISYIIRTYDQPALVEEFIDGREITVGILGNGRSATALPLCEVLFDNWDEKTSKVYSYEAKWYKDNESNRKISIGCPADLPKYQEYRIRKTALQVYNILGCRDYGRIDLRLTKEGVPYVLEMNPNPGISPIVDDGGQPEFIPFAAMKSGMSYDDLILSIFNFALERNNIEIKMKPLLKQVVVENMNAGTEPEIVQEMVETAENSNEKVSVGEEEVRAKEKHETPVVNAEKA